MKLTSCPRPEKAEKADETAFVIGFGPKVAQGYYADDQLYECVSQPGRPDRWYRLDDE